MMDEYTLFLNKDTLARTINSKLLIIIFIAQIHSSIYFAYQVKYQNCYLQTYF